MLSLSAQLKVCKLTRPEIHQ